MLPSTRASYTASNSAVVLDRFITIYTLSLPRYMVLASIGPSPSSIRATVVILVNSPGCKITHYSALPIGMPRHECPDLNLLSIIGVYENLQQEVLASVLHKEFGRAVYKTTIFLFLVISERKYSLAFGF